MNRGWLLHIDSVLWFPRKSLPWQWSALPWGVSLSQFATVELFLYHCAVFFSFFHKSRKMTYHCCESCVSSQNNTNTQINVVKMRTVWNDYSPSNLWGTSCTTLLPEACESTGWENTLTYKESLPILHSPVTATLKLHHFRAICVCASVSAGPYRCVWMSMSECIQLTHTCMHE